MNGRTVFTKEIRRELIGRYLQENLKKAKDKRVEDNSYIDLTLGNRSNNGSRRG